MLAPLGLPSPTRNNFLCVPINEAAVVEAGWESPEAAIGRGFPSPGSRKPDGVVIGVLKDYHHHGLQGQIGSMMYGIRSGNGFFALRLNSTEVASVIAHVGATWDQFFVGYPYDTFFLDDDFARQNEQEQRLMRIFGTSAIFTILIPSKTFGTNNVSAANALQTISSCLYKCGTIFNQMQSMYVITM